MCKPNTTAYTSHCTSYNVHHLSKDQSITFIKVSHRKAGVFCKMLKPTKLHLGFGCTPYVVEICLCGASWVVWCANRCSFKAHISPTFRQHFGLKSELKWQQRAGHTNMLARNWSRLTTHSMRRADYGPTIIIVGFQNSKSPSQIILSHAQVHRSLYFCQITYFDTVQCRIPRTSAEDTNK